MVCLTVDSALKESTEQERKLDSARGPAAKSELPSVPSTSTLNPAPAMAHRWLEDSSPEPEPAQPPRSATWDPAPSEQLFHTVRLPLPRRVLL